VRCPCRCSRGMPIRFFLFSPFRGVFLLFPFRLSFLSCFSADLIKMDGGKRDGSAGSATGRAKPWGSPTKITVCVIACGGRCRIGVFLRALGCSAAPLL